LQELAFKYFFVLNCLLLEMSTQLETDAFLQAHGIELDYDESDFESDGQTHKQLLQDRKLSLFCHFPD